MEKTTEKTQNRLFNRGDYLEILVFAALCLFVISPVIQILRELIAPPKETLFGPIRTYPFTVETINYFVALVAIIVWLSIVLRTLRCIRLGEQIKLFGPLVLFGILAFWMYLCQAVNGFTEYAYTGDPYRNESLYTFVLYILGYFFLGVSLKTSKLRMAVVVSFLIVNLSVGFLVLIDYYITPLEFYRDSQGVAAIFHQFNHYGYYLTLGILLSVMLFVESSTRWLLKLFGIFVYLTDIVILILNDTLGCYLAVIAALIFAMIVIISKRSGRSEFCRLVIAIVLLVIVTVGMHLLDQNNTHDVTKLASDIGNIAEGNENAQSAGTGRWALWTHTVEYIGEKPVFGWGVEGIMKRLEGEKDSINDRPHNEYLQWAAFFGIPGALLYLASLSLVMFGMLRNIKQAGAVSFACYIASAGYIASAFFGNTMYYTAPFFFIFLGMCCSDRFYRMREVEVANTPQE